MKDLLPRELRVDDQVELSFREKLPAGRGERVVDRTVLARVSWVDPLKRGEDGVEHAYFGYVPRDTRHGAWGCATLREVPREFGLRSVRRVGP